MKFNKPLQKSLFFPLCMDLKATILVNKNHISFFIK